MIFETPFLINKIASFCTKREINEVLIRISKTFFTTCYDLTWKGPFIAKDYEDICSKSVELPIRLLARFVSNQEFDLNRLQNDWKENFIKFLIRSPHNYILFLDIDRKRKNFNWGIYGFEYIRYSIIEKNINTTNFLLSKFNEVDLSEDDMSEFMKCAIATKCDDFIYHISRKFGIGVEGRFCTIKYLVEKKQYQNVLERIRDGNYPNFTDEEMSHIIDTLIENRRPDFIKVFLKCYQGKWLNNELVLRSFLIGDKESSYILINCGLMNLDEVFSSSKKTRVKDKLMIFSARNGWIELCKYLHEKHNADLAAENNMPFIEACRNGHLNTVKMFVVEYSGKIDPSSNQNYAYDESIRNGHEDIAEFLVKYCESVRDLNLFEKRGLVDEDEMKFYKHLDVLRKSNINQKPGLKENNVKRRTRRVFK